jgi:hypothetical protein
MSISKKLIAVAGATAMVLVTPSVAHAKPRPNTYRFTGGTSPTSINVTCAPGATTGKSATKLKVKATRKFSTAVTPEFIGNSLGQSNRFVASYPGGSMTLGRFETLYTINSQGKFTWPCPSGGATTSTFTINIQGFRGNKAVGTPAKVNVTLNRVGSAS